MKIAIDIDGTLTAWPEQFKRLLTVMPDAVVTFLTGALILVEQPATQAQLVAGRRRQIAPLIGELMGRTEIFVSTGATIAEVAHGKGVFCRAHGVDIFIDDTMEYCEAVWKLSPKTMVLKVVP